MWIYLGLISCLFLGLYDVAKKTSLNNNAVIPVLFFASLSGALVFAPIILISKAGGLSESHMLFVPQISWQVHLLIFAKSVLVGSSWIFAYIALKHLPITIVTPVRATGPLWTLLGALIIFNERYSLLQWLGMAVILGFFYYFSLAGKREGIAFKSNRWVLFIIIATFLGSISSLYDKYLIAHYHRMAIQAWFSVYMIPVFLPFLYFIWYRKQKTEKPFFWKWTIPLIGLLLVSADFAYFYALSQKESLITILSVLRRSSVIISFLAGAIIFKEVNITRKAFALLGILSGVLLLILSK